MSRHAQALLPAALALLAFAGPVAAAPVGQALVPITGCRSVDTRGPAAPNGGPALGASEVRVLPITGTCGVPANALGLVVNLTVVRPAAIGFAQLYAGDAPAPPTSVLAFTPNKTRAGFALVALASDGSGTVALANGSAGPADYLLDVLGYFIPACTATITVTNPATAAGAVNAPFSQTFTSSGGVGATTFSTASPLPAGLTLGANGVLSGTPTQSGTFPITVTATDANGCTGTGPTYTLVIACQTIAVANPATATGTANAPFSQTFTQTGGFGTTTFSTSSPLPVGMTLAANGVLSGTPTQAGTFPIVVVATDANGCTGTGATYTLVIGCQPISVTNPAVSAGTAGAAFSQTFTQTGAIGTPTFSLASGVLPAGLALAANGVLSGTPTVVGSFPITVKVTDGNLCTGTGATYTLVIGCQTIAVGNPATSTATAGTAFSQTFTQAGAVGSATFTTASPLPAGLALAANGTLSGTPTQTGTFPITIVATDAAGCVGSQDYVVTVSCVGVAITVAPPSVPPVASGSPFGPVTFTASGGTGPYTFARAGVLPTGMSFSFDTLAGTPTQPGTFPFTITATDASGCVGSTSYSLVVTCPTITVTNPATTTGTAGTAFSQQFTQAGGNGTVTFSTASALPAGLTLDADGTLHGTTTQTGSFPIVVKATDANGCTGTGPTYTLVIACQTITVTNPATTTGTEGAAFDQTFTATGILGAATWSKTGALPAGVTLNSATGHLSGTPTQTGTFPITVTATDANGCSGTSATYTLVITCPVITVTKPAVTSGTYGTAFSQTFTQTGGVGSTTFTLASGSLPAGLLLAANGTLSGTPTQTGSFPITVTATDAAGCTGTSASYALAVAPRLVSDTYPQTVIGNVSVNSALIPYSVTANDGFSGATTITAFDATSANGGTVAMTTSGAGMGQFTYNPPAGFTGVDTFTYTLTSNGLSGTATVSMTVSGMIWFVNNAAGAGDGRLSSPFNSLASFQAVNDGVGTHPGSNQSVFLYESGTAYAGPVTLRAGQKLVGQDSTSTLASITGLAPPSGSAALPAMNAANGTVTRITSSGVTVTLGTNNTVNGLTLGNATTSALKGTSFGTLTVADVIVSTTGASRTIDLNTGALAATFVSISASGGTNGIVLQNTTGTFTVAGTGGACTPSTPTCTGGTIQNMAGGDDSSAAPVGTGIVLNNAQNVSLTRMRISGNSNYGIRGTSVVGFLLDNSLLDGTTGTNAATPYNDGCISFDNLTGSATVSNTNIQGGIANNFRLVNTAGTLNRITFTNDTFDVSGANPTNDALTLESQNAAVVNVTVQNSFFKSAGGDLFQLNNIGTGADDLVFTGNALTNANSAIATGGGGVTIGSNGTGDITSNFAGNTLRDAVGHAILFFKSTGAATVTGTFDNNTIGVSGVANSGSAEGDGIKVQNAGLGAVKATLTNNQIRQYNNFGIDLVAGGGASASGGALNVVITGNTIAQPGNSAGSLGIPKNGIQLNAGTVPGDTYAVCAQIGGAGALANTMTGSGADASPPVGSNYDFRLRQRQNTTVRLPGYGGANNDNAAVVTYVAGNNGGPSGTASNTVGSGGGGFVGGAACLP